MTIATDAFITDLRRANCMRDFLDVCWARVHDSDHVKIDIPAVHAYAKTLRPPSFVAGWDDYLSPRTGSRRDRSIWGRTDDFIELAINTSINAGYLYCGDDGKTQKWEQGGSGAAALVTKMDQVRAMSALPGLQLKDPDTVVPTLRDVFNGVPFADERLAIWSELAKPWVQSGLKDILYSTRMTPSSKQHHFTFDHVRALGDLCPLAFGDDPFLKKAALLPILFAGAAHHRIGPGSVTMAPLVAADYRVPQTNHHLGLLRFSDALVDRLDASELMDETEDMVMDVRAATWLTETLALQLRPDIQAFHLDADKWFAGRLFDKPLDQLDDKKKAMRLALEKIGNDSGWDRPGFNRKSVKPMAVASMWF